MSDDEKEIKPTSKFGSIRRQWETIGGGKDKPDVQTSVQTPKHSDVEATKLRKRQTVYLYPELLRRIKHRIAETDEEISDVANKAIQEFLDREEGK